MRWRGNNPATAVWPDLESMLAVHGHHGATELRWLEQAPAAPSAEMAHLFGDHRTGRPPIAIAEPAQGPNRAHGWAGARHLR